MDGEIQPAEVEELIESDAEVRIVDVRPPDAYESKHLPGSESIPLRTLSEEVESLAGADRVICVCKIGQSSVPAARLVSAYEGIDESCRVESMAGGLNAWDGPTESSS